MTIDSEMQAIADEQTRKVQLMIDNYNQIRHLYNRIESYDYFRAIFNQYGKSIKEIKNPTKYKIRKTAGVGFFEEKRATKYDGKKAIVEKKLQDAREKLIAEAKLEHDEAQRYNERLKKWLDAEYKKLREHDRTTVVDYYKFVLHSSDEVLSELIDGYYPLIDLDYNPEYNQLIIDFQFPLLGQIPDVKGYKVTKDNKIKEEKMNKTDHLLIYEQILFDLAIRTVGLVFVSDNEKVLKEVVFNGYCIYCNGEIHRYLLSFVMKKSEFPYNRLNNLSFVSKKELSKLEKIIYIDNIKSDTPSNILKEDPPPPNKRIIPIQSSLNYN